MPRQTKQNWDREWEIPEEEQGKTYDDGFLFSPDTDEPDEKKKLKQELEREAMTRMEESARTEEDYQRIVDMWDHLDANRERRERAHEVLRGNGTPPLDYGTDAYSYAFPASLNSVLTRQIRNGEFLDTIFYCIYDIHELVSQEYLISPLEELPDDRKELLFLNLIEQWNTAKIAAWRKQTDRNVRKIRNTSLNRIRRKILPALIRMETGGEALTAWERRYLAKEKAASGQCESSSSKYSEESS